MSDVIRLFVASDPRMGVAERALENSVNENTTGPIEITWMRSGDPGWDDWNIGRAPGKPYSGQGWATEFTCFRAAIPELCGFKGRAIYLDVDMIVLGDLRELWEWPLNGKCCAIVHQRFDVIVYDCEKVGTIEGWPTLEQMKRSDKGLGRMMGLLKRAGAAQLPPEWDCLEGKGFCPHTKLVHFTDMRRQPWQPWPECFSYPGERRGEPAVDRFWEYAETNP